MKNKDWTAGDKRGNMWYKNLVADLQTSRTIRHVMREDNARAEILIDHPRSARRYLFRDNAFLDD